jgi:hypothetical protein
MTNARKSLLERKAAGKSTGGDKGEKFSEDAAMNKQD